MADGATNTRTATKAAIRRASRAARAKMNRLDKEALDRLNTLYRAAREDLARHIADYADDDGNLRLQVLRDLLEQVENRLQKLARDRDAHLNGSLTRAAVLGIEPLQVGAKAMPRIAEEAVRFVQEFRAADGLQLSDRLWKLDRQARTVVSTAIESAVIQGHSAHQAADAFLARGERIPKLVRDQLNKAGAKRIANQTGKALMREGGPYANALRVFRTEINRAHGEAYMAGAEDHPDVIGFRFLLSPRHPRPDICDLHANANLHGLGPGVYPSRESNPWPAHPNTLSYVEVVFRDEVSEADRGGKEDPIDWLKKQPGDVQVGVLGGQKKRDALQAGVLARSEINTPWNILKKRYDRRGIDHEIWGRSDTIETPPSGSAPPSPASRPARNPTPAFREARTIKDAEKWALDNGLTEKVRYKGLKLMTANRVNRHLAELFQQFEIQPYRQISAGTVGGASLAKANAHELHLQSKFFNSPEQVYQESVVDYQRRQRRLYQSAKMMLEEPDVADYKKRAARRQVADYEEGLVFKRSLVLLPGKAVECCLSHEFGHTLSDQRIGLINDIGKRTEVENWLATRNGMVITGDIYKISSYGFGKPMETFAEAFVMYVHERGNLPRYVITGGASI